MQTFYPLGKIMQTEYFEAAPAIKPHEGALTTVKVVKETIQAAVKHLEVQCSLCVLHSSSAMTNSDLLISVVFTQYCCILLLSNGELLQKRNTLLAIAASCCMPSLGLSFFT